MSVSSERMWSSRSSCRARFAGLGEQLVDAFVLLHEPADVVAVNSHVAQRGEQADLLALGVGKQQAGQVVDVIVRDRDAARQQSPQPRCQ